MRQALIKASVGALIKNGIIEDSDRELYQFGFNQLFLFLVNILTSLAVGAVCGMLWQSVLFSLAYIPLRRYAGGYHAKTAGRCYILSIVLIAAVLEIMKHVEFGSAVSICMLILADFIIWLKAPADSENKRLNENEKIAFRKKARQILAVENGIFIGCCLLSAWSIAECVTMAAATAAAVVLITERK